MIGVRFHVALYLRGHTVVCVNHLIPNAVIGVLVRFVQTRTSLEVTRNTGKLSPELDLPSRIRIVATILTTRFNI